MKNTTQHLRVERLQAELGGLGLKGALIAEPDNIFYFAGHLIGEGNGPALLFVPREGIPELAVPEDEASLPSLQSFSGTLLPYSMQDEEDGLHAASLRLREAVAGDIFPIGIEPGMLPLWSAQEIGISSSKNWMSITETIGRFRMIKDAGEITCLRMAAHIADEGQSAARSLYGEGVSEIELQSGCRSAMEVKAGRPMEFLADVLFGARTALIGSPAGVAGAYRATGGDPAIVDLLPRIDGYFADTTRTLWAGTPPAERKAVVSLLTEVRQVIEGLLRPGVPAIEIDDAARGRLSREGSFPHHTGHGIGISHYEAPIIRQGSQELLQPGMVITLEPGIYFNDWGARIEDDYLITEDGFEKLTGLESC